MKYLLIFLLSSSLLLIATASKSQNNAPQNKYEEWLEKAEALKDENPSESLTYVTQILDEDSANVAVDIRIKALQLKALGEMYNYQFAAADQSFARAHALLPYLYKEPKDEIVKGTLLLNMGRNFTWQSKFDTALSMMITSKTVFEDVDHTDGMAQSLNAIAIIYIQYSQDAQKALMNFNEALKLHFEANNDADAARVMQNIGQIFNMEGNNDSALYYLRLSNGLVTQLKDFRSLAVGSNILGAVFFDMNQLDSSEIYYKKAIELDLLNQDSVGLIYDYSQLATTLVAKRSLREAERYSLLAFENTKDIYIKTESAETLANIYESLGNTGTSLQYFKYFKQYSDSIKSEDQQATVSELQTKYETVEKQKEIELANIEIEKKQRFQTFLIVVIILILLFGIVAVLLLIQRFKLRRALLSQEIDTLRVQINSIFSGGIHEGQIQLEEINEGLHRPLTERELDVLNFAISDKSNREIADELFVSVNTIKTHLKNLYSKLGVTNRKEALDVVLQHRK